MTVEEPSKIEELGRWEEQEVERTMSTLREDDMLWERRKKGERSNISRSSTMSYGGKRGDR